ncbi:hypothetical protein [Streptomyces sp. NBC_00691]|uniref:hypothetical protein n=1 Tax=Streptomyces sp. NBC_00691 TaxID=2903671 RepID=UPI002E2F4A2C|nr:hypothetical protein [Streptomyces sp. NBC_00691]
MSDVTAEAIDAEAVPLDPSGPLLPSSAASGPLVPSSVPGPSDVSGPSGPSGPSGSLGEPGPRDVSGASPLSRSVPAERPGFGSGGGSHSGSDSGWSPRIVRLGAPRPGPAARGARRFGVPLVPLLVAGLVAGAFVAARGGNEQNLSTAERPGGDRIGAPSPVISGDGERRNEATPPSAGGRAPASSGAPEAAGGRTADTPSADTTPDATPTRTASPHRTVAPGKGPSATPPRTGGTTATTRPNRPATGGGGSSRPVSFEALRVGDCFDIDRGAPGTALRRSCDTPHHAELVARLRLTGLHATDTAIREAAALLCREPLRRKAARQPLGTRWTTFVQYPYRTSYLLGSDVVACSLAVTTRGDGALSRPLT